MAPATEHSFLRMLTEPVATLVGLYFVAHSDYSISAEAELATPKLPGNRKGAVYFANFRESMSSSV